MPRCGLRLPGLCQSQGETESVSLRTSVSWTTAEGKARVPGCDCAIKLGKALMVHDFIVAVMRAVVRRLD